MPLRYSSCLDRGLSVPTVQVRLADTVLVQTVDSVYRLFRYASPIQFLFRPWSQCTDCSGMPRRYSSCSGPGLSVLPVQLCLTDTVPVQALVSVYRLFRYASPIQFLFRPWSQCTDCSAMPHRYSSCSGRGLSVPPPYFANAVWTLPLQFTAHCGTHSVITAGRVEAMEGTTAVHTGW
jgi:hypothetical protein